jgi:hypothetical protein
MRQSTPLLLGLALLVFASATGAQTAAPRALRPSLALTNIVPPIPVPQPPVAFFRQLLMMSPMERNAVLTNRPAPVRARILAKIHEYQVLNPDERELRLRATELRWYLTPLMRAGPTNREPQLARVPEELQGLVRSRLVQWDLLPPPLQQEFLANDQTVHYFTQTSAAADAGSRKTADEFEKFFELLPGEKEKLLRTLSAPERAQMEKTLKAFDQLPQAQRALCIRNYATFAGMSGAERSEFLKNAESWSKMSPQERQAWRDLVAHVPLWPPLPPSILPPPINPRIAQKMATN